MKRLLALIIFALVIFVACSGEDVEISDESSESISLEQSIDESKPWYSTSAPENVSNPSYESSEVIDEWYESSVDNGESEENEESASEESTPIVDINDYSTLPLSESVYKFKNNASAYGIVFTKNSALNATSCITNTISGVTAIYDGSFTRFFGAVDGMYYGTAVGKYLYPCCDGGFIAGDLSYYKASDSVVVEYDEASQGYKIVKNPADAHSHGEHGEGISFYSSIVGLSFELESGDLCRHSADGYAICRLYDGPNVADVYLSGAIFSNEFELTLGKYGVVKDNKVVIPFEYDNILSANFDNCGVFLAVKEGRCYYFSSSGVNLTPNGFDSGSQPFSDRAWVFEDGQGWIIKFN